jgi:hypothetical protein
VPDITLSRVNAAAPLHVLPAVQDSTLSWPGRACRFVEIARAGAAGRELGGGPGSHPVIR